MSKACATSGEVARDGPTLEEDDWTKRADAEWTEQVDDIYKVEPFTERGNQQVYRASDLTGLPVRDKQGETTLGSLYEITFQSHFRFYVQTASCWSPGFSRQSEA